MGFDIVGLAGISLDELLRAVAFAVPIAAVLLLAHLRRSRSRVVLSLLEVDERSGSRRS